MSRLVIAWMSVLTTALVATICWYVVTLKAAAKEGVIFALGGALLTIAAKTIVAIINRNGPADDK